MSDPSAADAPRPRLPDAAALVVGPRRAVWLSGDGEIDTLTAEAAAARARAAPPYVCHARATAQRLDIPPFRAFDLLELFAFVHPARFSLPTPAGLADSLGLERPRDDAGAALTLFSAATVLLRNLASSARGDATAARIATIMAGAGWSWGPAVLSALGIAGPRSDDGFGGLDVWQRLPEWQETGPEPPPGDVPVSEPDARARLAALLGAGAEIREAQADYTALAARAFAPRRERGAPNLVLAEAGTGIGKTLGYVAPASLWAERNGGAVWLSTYTKNLQRQVDQELDRLYPEPEVKKRKAVIRKGRENYLCLLNLEDAVRAAVTRPADRVALGLMARWAGATRDGDMVGGDFPSWLAGLLGTGRTLGLADRRGECIYSACPHYGKCFIERTVRKARRADIVVANHALVMIQAVLGGDEVQLPLRYVFDEGHHVFDAADGAFSAHLSGFEAAELRRWILGNESGRRPGRARGLKARIGDLIADDAAAGAALEATLQATHALPGDGWLRRLTDGGAYGPTERFLARVRQHVLARAPTDDTPYSLEAGVTELDDGLIEAAAVLSQALARLETALGELGRQLAAKLDDEASALDTPTRLRIEASCRGLKRRGEMAVGAWRSMLGELSSGRPEDVVDWFSIERSNGRDQDVGMHRHWVDPTTPFAATLLARAHGVLVTSATLRDRPPDLPEDWTAAEVRTGALHLPLPAVRGSFASPFDYSRKTRIIVVTDVRRNDPDQTAAAYRELFKATGGGALGLFTAISRLRQVYGRIAGPLDECGIPLLAQHVDAMDTGTLVDIFRAEVDACLLGTDAVRDGVDVPGRSLRLIVLDRVPWPRPDILHRARKARFGGGAYDDLITRLRLKQAYGRLVRRAGDRGVFVLLDAMLPTRLATAFPDDVPLLRVGLAEAIAETAAFLASTEGG